MATRSPGALAHLSPAGFFSRGAGWLVLAAIVASPVLSINFADTASIACVYAMTALSLNILIGYTGQLSLGHQGFIGVGSLVAANLATQAHWPFALTLVGAAGAGALIALLLGLVALRITGLYLSLITLVFGVVVASSLFQTPSLTKGGAGIEALRPSALTTNQHFYLFALGALIFVIFIDRQLTASKTGRALLALKENERVAEAFGIGVTRYKLIAFLLSGSIAGFAGGVYVFELQQFSAQNFQGITGINLALLFVVMVVVGGQGSRAGVVVAGAFFAILENILDFIFKHGAGVLHHIPLLSSYYQADSKAAVSGVLSALLLLQTLIFNPGGINGQIKPFLDWLSGSKFSFHSAKESGPGAVEGSSVRA